MLKDFFFFFFKPGIGFLCPLAVSSGKLDSRDIVLSINQHLLTSPIWEFKSAVVCDVMLLALIAPILSCHTNFRDRFPVQIFIHVKKTNDWNDGGCTFSPGGPNVPKKPKSPLHVHVTLQHSLDATASCLCRKRGRKKYGQERNPRKCHVQYKYKDLICYIQIAIFPIYI